MTSGIGNKTRRHARMGLTLIELMVAVVIFALGAAGIMRAYAALATADEEAGRSVHETLLQKDLLSGLILKRLQSSTLSLEEHGESALDTFYVWKLERHPGFNRHAAISETRIALQHRNLSRTNEYIFWELLPRPGGKQ